MNGKIVKILILSILKKNQNFFFSEYDFFVPKYSLFVNGNAFTNFECWNEKRFQYLSTFCCEAHSLAFTKNWTFEFRCIKLFVSFFRYIYIFYNVNSGKNIFWNTSFIKSFNEEIILLKDYLKAWMITFLYF